MVEGVDRLILFQELILLEGCTILPLLCPSEEDSKPPHMYHNTIVMAE